MKNATMTEKKHSDHQTTDGGDYLVLCILDDIAKLWDEE